MFEEVTKIEKEEKLVCAILCLLSRDGVRDEFNSFSFIDYFLIPCTFIGGR